MNEEVKHALTNKLLALADDEFILGHRNSEWAGHAPILEEDIAFANIAQDELGHANIWYSLYSRLTAADADELVYWRDAAAYRNAPLVELPQGDWAFSMLRQYLFDTAELIRLPLLAESRYSPLAEAAGKIRPEEIYHYRHTHAWIKRLGLGTEESNRRLQTAVATLWPHTRPLFAPLPDEQLLVEAGYVPDPAGLEASWRDKVIPFLTEAGLAIPAQTEPANASRTEHTPHLDALLADLQQVARLYPEAQW
jgi:ring-1,2-phenylacetyl-CoA epoxidase subunit PaaC